MKDLLTLDQARCALDYDPLTGVFRWRVGRRLAGKVAGAKTNHGYIRINVDHKLRYAHRLAWLITYGEWPSFVDHINGQRDDNRIANLRSTTNQNNVRNRRGHGRYLKGVSFEKRTLRWVAQICVDYRRIGLGTFATEIEAHEAYMAAARRYFGDFARAA